jgi:hyperosmotically inducible protein
MRVPVLCIALVLLASLSACREEGAAEKAGRKLDEAIESLTHPTEGKLEEFGRKADEALAEAQEALEEARQALEEGLEDAKRAVEED